MALNLLSLGRHSLSDSDSDFGFAFNDKNFSDRVLRIEISVGVVEPKSEEVQNCTDGDNRKRKRTEDTEEKENDLQADEHKLNCKPEQNTADGYDHPKEEEAVKMQEDKEEEAVKMHENNEGAVKMQEDKEEEVVKMQEDKEEETVKMQEDKEEEAVKMQEESPLVPNTIPNTNMIVDEAGNSVESILQVKNIHISSLILASKSIHFYELFLNEAKESENNEVTLRIPVSEEAALMELLRFMYSNTLSTTSPPELFEVLLAADKYQVSSCIRYCTMRLQSLPMTFESALIFLHLLSSIRMVDEAQPLLDASKKHLAMHFNDFTKYPKELLKLPLVGVEAVLASDDLHLPTEDSVYDFLLKWASLNYKNPEERREIMSTRLCPLIRFHHMSCRKLKNALTCSDFDYTVSQKFVMEALFYKSEPPYKQRQMAGTGNFPVERNYKYRMAKMVEFETPRPQCIVYIDIKREECVRLFTAHAAYVQVFILDDQGFFLSANIVKDEETHVHSFGLFLGMKDKGGNSSVSVDYDFLAMSKPNQEFKRRYKGNYTFVGGNAVGYRNLFNSVEGEDFLAEDCVYFIDDMLHLKVELTIRK